MILDSFKLHSVTFQITYSNSYKLWDSSGCIATGLCSIWPNLKLSEGVPERQVFKGDNVTVNTGLNRSTITLSGPNSLNEKNVKFIQETFELWREKLDLVEVKQLSTLANYAKDFDSIKKANEDLLSLNMARWPSDKIFEQPMDTELNSLELFYRFQDDSSFSTIKLKAQQTTYNVHLDKNYVDTADIEKTNNQILIIFDRGLLGSVNAEKFRANDWIKGFQHVLRRDIEKLIKAPI